MRFSWKSSEPVRDSQIGTPDPYPWWRRHWRKITIPLLVCIVIAGALAWYVSWSNPCGLGSGLEEEPGGSACVGLDLNSTSFQTSGSDPLSGLEKTVSDGNRQISGSGYVTIVYLDDMEPNADENVTPAVLEQRVEGVITAQRAANNTNIAHSEDPKVRVLLASYGNDANQESYAVQQIKNNRKSQHIVAVTGIGQSLVKTQNAISQITGAGIPVVGSVVSGDALVDGNVGHGEFYRTSSTDSDEVSAAFSYIHDKGYRNVVMARDTNSSDEYVRDLGRDYTNKFEQQNKNNKPYTVDYSSSGAGALKGVGRSSYMENHVFESGDFLANICDRRPDAIYFAGRGDDMLSFLHVLESDASACSLSHVDIISADDVNAQIENSFPTGNIQYNVFYTALATGGEWGSSQGETPEARGYSAFSNQFSGLIRKHVIPSVSLTDGYVMMEYDALLTAAVAARDAGQAAAVSSPKTVADQLSGFDCGNNSYVPGASGRIMFSIAGTPNGQQGNPIDKPVPIMQLEPDSGVSMAKMEWSDGSPIDTSVCG